CCSAAARVPVTVPGPRKLCKLLVRGPAPPLRERSAVTVPWQDPIMVSLLRARCACQPRVGAATAAPSPATPFHCQSAAEPSLRAPALGPVSSEDVAWQHSRRHGPRPTIGLSGGVTRHPSPHITTERASGTACGPGCAGNTASASPISYW